MKWMKKRGGQQVIFCGWGQCFEFSVVIWQCWFGDKKAAITKKATKGFLSEQVEEKTSENQWSVVHVECEFYNGVYDGDTCIFITDDSCKVCMCHLWFISGVGNFFHKGPHEHNLMHDGPQQVNIYQLYYKIYM